MSLVFAGTDYYTSTITYRIYLEASPTNRDEFLPPFKAITTPKASVAIVSVAEAAAAGFVPNFPSGLGPWIDETYTSGVYRTMVRPGDFQRAPASSTTDMTLAYPAVPYTYLETEWGARVPADTSRWGAFDTPTIVTVTKPIGNTMVNQVALGVRGPPGVRDYVCEWYPDQPFTVHSFLQPLGILTSISFSGNLDVVVGFFDVMGAWQGVNYAFLPPGPYGAIFPFQISTVCYDDGVLYLSNLNALTTGPFYTMAITLTEEQKLGQRPGGTTGLDVEFPSAGYGPDGDFSFVIGGSGRSARNISALRLAQRDDGLGIGGHPRLRASGHMTSTQLTAAPRVGGRSTYS